MLAWLSGSEVQTCIMVQPMPLPLTVSCFTKIQIGFTFLVLAHPGSPGQRAIKRVCVCVCVLVRLDAPWLCIIAGVQLTTVYVSRSSLSILVDP